MLTYTRALEVEPGQCATSAQRNTLAAAINDRLRGGVADPTWRLWWRASSVVRQLCASGAGSAPVDDYWRYWNLVDPRTEVGFECAAGDNEVNPLVGFSAGNALVDSEETRLALVTAPSNAGQHELWLAAANQRGGIVPGGASAATAYSAARSHQALNYASYLAPFLKGYGGYFSVPLHGVAVGRDVGEEIAWTAWLQRCVRDDEHYFYPRVFIFSPIAGGQPQVFWPTPLINYTWNQTDGCYDFTPDSDPNSAAFHANIATVLYGPDTYVLRSVGGTITELKRSEYVEGPYGYGGMLTWSDGRQLENILQWYADDFKGSSTQRHDGYRVKDLGADWQSFFTRQYALAPAYGVLVGQEIVVTYPLFTGGPGLNQGDYLTVTAGGSGTYYDVHAGFVFAAYYATAHGLAAPLKLEAVDLLTNEILATLTLPAGSAETLVYLTDVTTAPRVAWRAANQPAFDAGGGVAIEIAELLNFKPHLADAYLLLRLATTRGDPAATLDTVGLDYPSAPDVVKNFQRYGCIISDEALPIQANAGLTQNPIFETCRQHFAENFRFVDRVTPAGQLSLASYTVQNGNSILKFRRYITFGGETYDCFRGLAPPEGQGEGIRHTAPDHGMSNEWLMFIATHRSGTGAGNWCKPDSYGDVLAHLHDRCTMFDPLADPFSGATDLADHLTYATGGPVAENPTGLRYAPSRTTVGRLNSPSPSANFMSSCQIYLPDYEIDSATLEGSGANQLVVLRLIGRLRHTAAVNDFGNYGTDGNGQLTEAGAAPAYRTDENAILEYLIDNNGAGPFCRTLVGDNAYAATVSECNGSCHPHFHFTRLVPKVHEDTPPDEISGPTDTMWIERELEWAVFVLQAMCEGYLDPRATAIESCPGMLAADYRWERLCQDIAAQAPFTVIPSELTGSSLAWDDSAGGWYTIQARDPGGTGRWENEDTVSSSPYTVDHPTWSYRVVKLAEALHHLLLFPLTVRTSMLEGFGPISNTCIYAEIFNQLARGLNLLTMARVELPLTLQSRQAQFERIELWDPTLLYGPACQPPTCTDGTMLGEVWASSDTSVPNPDTLVGSWSAWSSSAPSTSTIAGGPHYEEWQDYDVLLCDENGIYKKGTETRWQVRVDPNASYLSAVSAHIRDQLQAYPAVFCQFTKSQDWSEAGTQRAITVCDPPTGPACLTHYVDDFASTAVGCIVLTPSGAGGETELRADLPHNGEIRYWRSGVTCGTGRYVSNHGGPVSTTQWTVTMGEAAISIPLL